MIVHYASLIVLLIGICFKFDIMMSLKNILSVSLAGNDKTTLLVGVMSAQANYRARKAIRETWGQLTKNRSIEIKFLIGDEICPYPFEDRITPYSCNLWLINTPKVLDEYSTINGPTRSEGCSIGYTFLVKSTIVLRSIGLDYIAFSGNSTDKARVVLVNSKTGKKVASATFMKDNTFGFSWKPIPTVVLDDGFEGEIKMIGDGLQMSYCSQSLQYIASVYFFETLDSDNVYTKYELGDFKPTLVGMNYSFRDIAGLQEILVDRVSRFNKWPLTTSLIKQQIEEEQMIFGDILLLSGFIDVYDNLSVKTSLFYDWVKIVDNWKYILKTDDDVFVDLALIEKELDNTWDIWTCMRRQNPNPWGKWRDKNAKSYPPFPSGSGYILSREIVRDLELNPKEKLGEDVMMGYCLEEGLRQPSDSPCCWACGAFESDCEAVCNMPELDPSQLRKLWKLYSEVGHIPSYHEI